MLNLGHVRLLAASYHAQSIKQLLGLGDTIRVLLVQGADLMRDFLDWIHRLEGVRRNMTQYPFHITGCTYAQ